YQPFDYSKDNIRSIDAGFGSLHWHLSISRAIFKILCAAARVFIGIPCCLAADLLAAPTVFIYQYITRPQAAPSLVRGILLSGENPLLIRAMQRLLADDGNMTAQYMSPQDSLKRALCRAFAEQEDLELPYL